MSAHAFPIPAGGDDAAARAGARAGGSGQQIDQPNPIARLVEASTEFKDLANLPWPDLAHEDARTALKALELVFRTATAIQARVLESVGSSGSWAEDGERSLDTWVTTNTGTTRSTASRSVRLAKSMKEDLPGTREALARGEISTDHARIISQRCTATEKQRERLADPEHGERLLLEKAKRMNAGQFSKFAATWAIETDPKAADRNYRREKSQQEFSLTPTEDGYRASGWFNLVNGALLKEALSAHMGRRAKNDSRSFTERQADGLMSLAAQSLDAGIQLPHARVRPHLIVTMEYDTIERLVEASGPIIPESFGGTVDEGAWAQQWRRGDDHLISTALDYSKLEGITPATLSDGTPLPPGVLARIACNSMLTRVVFGPQSVILNAGREERIFTAGQTRAIIARDKTCRYPGCDEGPGFGEVHHSISWAKHNGRTDVDLGILLCFHHHDVVHERQISILRRSGRWVFIDRFGKQITTPGHRFTPLDPAHSRTGASVPTSGESPPGTAPPSGEPPGTAPPGGVPPDWHQPGIFSQGPPPF